MTDRELMQQALEALELLARYENPATKIQVRKPKDGGPIVTMYPHKVATDAAVPLRERLAQPETKHDDPIGDAQDKLIAEQTSRSCKVGGPCVPTQTGPCACKELPPPIVPVVEQPQMQPCAGRNCGSTNPNLHSAECFEDYEKATGMNQWHGLTDEEHAQIAIDSGCASADWIDYAKKIEAKLKEKNT